MDFSRFFLVYLCCVVLLEHLRDKPMIIYRLLFCALLLVPHANILSVETKENLARRLRERERVNP